MPINGTSFFHPNRSNRQVKVSASEQLKIAKGKARKSAKPVSLSLSDQWDKFCKNSQSLPISNRSKLPEAPGVYALVTDSVEYIGTSKNLKSRWVGHHLLPEFSKNPKASIYYCQYSDSSMASLVESHLINQVKPPLNKSIPEPADIIFSPSEVDLCIEAVIRGCIGWLTRTIEQNMDTIILLRTNDIGVTPWLKKRANSLDVTDGSQDARIFLKPSITLFMGGYIDLHCSGLDEFAPCGDSGKDLAQLDEILGKIKNASSSNDKK